ncbi:V-set and immunoglobulin domain-containing protein 1 isoform X1 [Geospiza fortis]|uniref:V-set and immunoglobulin domain-containing protein 1 n=1 Tax=Geospiza parvula TaxID=87175 RepID=UPI000395699A|nr:V-set and immunoglobulin domain-containing protein 1 isoform X1 [Geospiza fortis]XP_030823614.1 V-set and immunoglobulin domain-containing protein 1 [Camarhynchus parvulus]
MCATVLKIFPIVAILAGHSSGVVVTVPEKTVNVTTGGNATLLCTYTSSGTLGNFFIQWSFYSAKESQLHTHSPCHGILSMDEKSVSLCQKTVYVTDARGRCSWRYKIYYYSGGQSYSYGAFKNRITASTSPGNASITISNMQPSDTGSYTCEVFSPQGDAAQSQKSVIVNVLVKPSKPFCKVEGTPEKGHLIYLLCNCEEGLPRPTYHWYKVDENTLKPVTEQLDPNSGILYIGNLTTFETGYYRCIASNLLGNSTCELDLTAKHSDGGIVAGALIGAILAAAIICIIVWVFTKKAKNRKSPNNEMQEMVQKQSNADYVQVPNEENIPVTTVPSSNATNEYPSVDETAPPATPENDEKQEAEKEETA